MPQEAQRKMHWDSHNPEDFTPFVSKEVGHKSGRKKKFYSAVIVHSELPIQENKMLRNNITLEVHGGSTK